MNRSRDPTRQHGVVLVTVLLLIGFLGASVASYVLVSALHRGIGSSLAGSRRAHTLARAGVETWLGRVRVSALEGETPAVDHQNDPWGWGGTLLPGRAMHRRIHLPSLDDEPSEGDLGFFEIALLEDEGGKIDPLDPPADPGLESRSLEGGGVAGRSLSPAEARDLLAFVRADPSRLITLGGLLGVRGIGPGSLDSLRRIYSAYRTRGEAGRLNVNTAPYEALRGLQVNRPGTSPLFLSRAMAEAIIVRRSCSSPGDAPHRVRKEDYSPGCSTARPYRSVRAVCRHLNRHPPPSVVGRVECRVLRRHATTQSGGFLRTVVRGVSLGDEGDILSETCLDVVVDRRALSRGDGPLKVVRRTPSRCPG